MTESSTNLDIITYFMEITFEVRDDRAATATGSTFTTEVVADSTCKNDVNICKQAN